MPSNLYDYLLRDKFVQRMLAYKYQRVPQVGKNQVLYKYRSAQSDYFRDDLTHLIARRALYFSRQDQLNDPLDCLPAVQPGIDAAGFKAAIVPILSHIQRNKLLDLALRERFTPDLYLHLLRRIKGRTDEEIQSYFESGFATDIVAEGVNKVCVFCLTEENNNDAMWSMYASQGNGVCIGLSEWSPAGVQGTYTHPLKVQYNADRFLMTFARALTYFAFMQPGYLGGIDPSRHAFLEDSMDGLLYGLFKSIHWSYEREYRLMMHESAGYLAHESVQVHSVYLGHRLEPSQADWVRQLVAENAPTAQVFRCRLSESQYGYTFEPPS